MTTRDPPADRIEPNERPATDEPARQYLRIRPTDDSLSTDTIDAHVRRLHSFTGSNSTGSLLDRFRPTPQRPTIECPLVSRGTADVTITHAVGIDDPGGIEPLGTALRMLLPARAAFAEELWGEGFDASAPELGETVVV